jgi:WhiB family transcriptional regulator, redox-sensing transcriptional regulator
VSTSSRLHLSLVPGAVSASPVPSPWTDLSPVGDASWRLEALCLEFALANDERFGIWGGLSERERRRLRLQQRTGLSA